MQLLLCPSLCVYLTPPSHAPAKSSFSLSLIASMRVCLEEALPVLSPPSVLSQ